MLSACFDFGQNAGTRKEKFKCRALYGMLVLQQGTEPDGYQEYLRAWACKNVADSKELSADYDSADILCAVDTRCMEVADSAAAKHVLTSSLRVVMFPEPLWLNSNHTPADITICLACNLAYPNRAKLLVYYI